MEKTMKKIYMIAIALIMVLSLAACGGGGGGGGGGAGGGDTSAPLTSGDEDPCECCPDCTQGIDCEYDCEECECCMGSGGGSYTFDVVIDTNLTGSLGQVYRTIGTATVTLDEFDDSGWFGSAEGYGEYSDWGDEIYAETENATSYDFFVRLANYDPLKSDSITVGTDTFCSNAGNRYVMLSFEWLRQDLIDEATGLYTFELPMENGIAKLTDHWEEPAPGLIVIDMTITVTPAG